MPLVSIITPAYNAAGYLDETLRSIRAQTVSDWELLLVDDGSTDATLRIARTAAARDRRVRVIATPNQGQSLARNLAMREARGRLFALLDSDDLWLPHYLEAQIAVLEQHPDIAVVSANVRYRGGP